MDLETFRNEVANHNPEGPTRTRCYQACWEAYAGILGTQVLFMIYFFRIEDFVSSTLSLVQIVTALLVLWKRQFSFLGVTCVVASVLFGVLVAIAAGALGEFSVPYIVAVGEVGRVATDKNRKLAMLVGASVVAGLMVLHNVVMITLKQFRKTDQILKGHTMRRIEKTADDVQELAGRGAGAIMMQAASFRRSVTALSAASYEALGLNRRLSSGGAALEGGSSDVDLETAGRGREKDRHRSSLGTVLEGAEREETEAVPALPSTFRSYRQQMAGSWLGFGEVGEREAGIREREGEPPQPSPQKTEQRKRSFSSLLPRPCASLDREGDRERTEKDEEDKKALHDKAEEQGKGKEEEKKQAKSHPRPPIGDKQTSGPSDLPKITREKSNKKKKKGEKEEKENPGERVDTAAVPKKKENKNLSRLNSARRDKDTPEQKPKSAEEKEKDRKIKQEVPPPAHRQPGQAQRDGDRRGGAAATNKAHAPRRDSFRTPLAEQPLFASTGAQGPRDPPNEALPRGSAEVEEEEGPPPVPEQRRESGEVSGPSGLLLLGAATERSPPTPGGTSRAETPPLSHAPLLNSEHGGRSAAAAGALNSPFRGPNRSAFLREGSRLRSGSVTSSAALRRQDEDEVRRDSRSQKEILMPHILKGEGGGIIPRLFSSESAVRPSYTQAGRGGASASRRVGEEPREREGLADREGRISQSLAAVTPPRASAPLQMEEMTSITGQWTNTGASRSHVLPLALSAALADSFSPARRVLGRCINRVPPQRSVFAEELLEPEGGINLTADMGGEAQRDRERERVVDFEEGGVRERERSHAQSRQPSESEGAAPQGLSNPPSVGERQALHAQSRLPSESEGAAPQGLSNPPSVGERQASHAQSRLPSESEGAAPQGLPHPPLPMLSRGPSLALPTPPPASVQQPPAGPQPAAANAPQRRFSSSLASVPFVPRAAASTEVPPGARDETVDISEPAQGTQRDAVRPQENREGGGGEAGRARPLGVWSNEGTLTVPGVDAMEDAEGERRLLRRWVGPTGSLSLSRSQETRVPQQHQHSSAPQSKRTSPLLQSRQQSRGALSHHPSLQQARQAAFPPSNQPPLHSRQPFFVQSHPPPHSQQEPLTPREEAAAEEDGPRERQEGPEKVEAEGTKPSLTPAVTEEKEEDPVREDQSLLQNPSLPSNMPAQPSSSVPSHNRRSHVLPSLDPPRDPLLQAAQSHPPSVAEGSAPLVQSHPQTDRNLQCNRTHRLWQRDRHL
uniref:Uncharacterized protein n=1 Tax=Chromera velia CCMP2878 TaxID=1169474 RepID=A0A0G4F3W6_9ALVE|eukprot:Cvel_14941.t1-p1 / transcript=Cvel_14941.t1 / gene=Cvel_14941 / organism=Chromera_velia_CCMP2878 / gene_product=hypothetical protein / transcript_product=hypothetical protein / location=Cvel_scaffold1084:4612-11245(-) / protein_length=1247 / sequence_SO=supercontig / SO=protein_coding / is_pseudo=false